MVDSNQLGFKMLTQVKKGWGLNCQHLIFTKRQQTTNKSIPTLSDHTIKGFTYGMVSSSEYDLALFW